MSKKELELLVSHYRNLYQITEKNKNELERELDEYKSLSTMQQDIITSLNKRIDLNNWNNKVLENNLKELLELVESKYLINKDNIATIKTIRIK